MRSQNLHRWSGEFAEHHVGKSWQQQVAPTAAGGEHTDTIERLPRSVQAIADRARGHCFRRGVGDAVFIDTVMPERDAVLVEDALLDAR